jgi:hypothetical protein
LTAPHQAPAATPTPTIAIICVAYKRYGPLKVLVQSFLNQMASNWTLSVYHDGYDEGFERVMQSFAQEGGEKNSYRCLLERYNDSDHSLGAEALKHVTSEYVLMTNDDNYYVPLFIQLITQAIQETAADVVYFDMIHSHQNPGKRPLPPYSYFPTAYKRDSIDIGAAVVRSSLALQAGIRDRAFDADATYFEDIARIKGPTLKLHKLNRGLFVHN